MAITQHYVDPSINANSGTGTIGDPFGDLQYALNTVTRDSTNGDQFNIKSGTAEVLTAELSFASYGTTTASAPAVFAGYTSAANDGGIGVIDGNAGGFRFAYNVYTVWKDLELRNSGNSPILIGNAAYTIAINCTFHGATSSSSSNAAAWRMRCYGCNFYDCINGAFESDCFGCGFFDGSNRNFNRAIYFGYMLVGNVIYTAGVGISGHNSGAGLIANNSIFMTSSNYGISISGSQNGKQIVDNLVEGQYGISALTPSVFRNSVFASNTAYNLSNATFDSNETLSASPFEKTGAATWANAKAYFAPADVGNVRTGAYSSIDGVKGAIGVQATSGGGGAVLHPLASALHPLGE